MLTDTKRRIAAVVTGMMALFALSGCYTMKSETVYHADGTIDASTIIAIDDSLLADQVGDVDDPGQAFFDQMAADPRMADLADKLGDSMTVEPYAQDGQSGMVVTLVNVKPDDVARVNSAQGAPSGDSTITVADGKITLDYVTDPDLMANDDGSLAVVGDMMGMDVDSLSEFIDVEVRHTFPGPVESTTVGEIDPANPNSVIITDLSELSRAAPYTIVASDGTSSALSLQWILILAILAIVVIGGVVTAVVIASRKKPVVSSVPPPGSPQVTTEFTPEPTSADHGDPATPPPPPPPPPAPPAPSGP